MVDTSSRRKLLLIGWDAADWKIIEPLLDQGRMPHLARLVEAGVMGNLATLQPCLSPLLWTTIATGKTADQHGITGFVESLPDGSGVRPSTSTSRTARALWEMTTRRGLRSLVIGWFASHPAEPIEGVIVSDRFCDGPPPDPGAPWPLTPGTVHPAELSDSLAPLRLHPAELEPPDLRPLIPRIGEIDHAQDDRPWALAKCLAKCVSIHAAATELLARESWDFAAVYYDALDAVGHDFMPYHPPAMSHVSARDAALYGGVMTGLYEFHDQMLGRLLELAGEECSIVLVSDHGFHSGRMRPRPDALGGTPEQMAAAWHRPYGIFAACGPGIIRDERVHGATLLDVAPTVLMLLGLPIGEDMPGRPLTSILQSPPAALATIPTWETEGDSVPPPPQETQDPVAAAAVIRQLIALGYLPAEAGEGARAVEIAERERAFNLGIVHLHHGRPAAALPLLEPLCRSQPTEPRYVISAARALAGLGRHHECRAALAALTAAVGRHAEADALMIASWLAEGRADEAVDLAREGVLAHPPSPGWQLLLGQACAARRLWPEAKLAFQRGLEMDGEDPLLHCGLAAALLELREDEPAAEHALAAVAQLHAFPEAHLHLATALARLGDPRSALRALDIALTLTPDYPAAHRLREELRAADGR